MDAPRSLAARALGGGSGAQGLVRSLSIAVALQWAGAGSILPLLPLYVKSRGGSDAVVGAVMAAYFAGAFVFQYGAGRLADRLGRMPVLLGGLVVYAAGSALFTLPGPAVLGVVFRALQGAGSGGAMVAALAMLSHALPLDQRGRATGRLYGAQLGGLAVGPVLGSFAGLSAMRWLFLAAAFASLLSAVPVLLARAPHLEDALVAPSRPPSDRERGGRHRVGERALFGALVASAAIGVTGGVYEACWSLLMSRHGAVAWEIGVSWTFFALPFAVVSKPAGWLADHFDRRWLAVGALLWTAAFCATYPFLPGFLLLMVLSIFESLGMAIALPACQSLLGEGTAPERQGRAQGLFAASQTGTMAIAAAAGGALFGVGEWVPFVVGATGCAVLVGEVARSWRRVPGRVRKREGSPTSGGPALLDPAS